MPDFELKVECPISRSIVRTSPDHGVAYDLAGKGEASPRSMEAAIRLAVEIAGRRRRRPIA